jgi:hypothetical protein
VTQEDEATDKLHAATEAATAATRRTHEAVSDAKQARTDLRTTTDEARDLLARLSQLRDALNEVLP